MKNFGSASTYVGMGEGQRAETEAEGSFYRVLR